jgi:hypothetical protein
MQLSIMIRILISSIIYFAITFSVAASQQKPNTYQGEIELKEGGVREGKINIDFETDIVRFFNEDGTVDTYSPHNIVSLYFYDDLINLPRTFVTLHHSPKKNTTSGFYLYELMKVGKMDILRKAIKNINTEKLAQYPFSERVHKYDRVFEYYVFFSGELIPLSEFNNSILPIIKAKMHGELETFIARRGLDLRDKLQPLLVIEYFNAIKEEPLFKASLD